MRSILRKLGESFFLFDCLSLDWTDVRGFSECKPIEYPAPQPPLSTDLLTALALTATNHTENQPVHLQLPHMGVNNFDSAAVSSQVPSSPLSIANSAAGYVGS